MLSSLLLIAAITWPPGAQIIERANVPSPHGPRQLVLWIENPTRHPDGETYCGSSVHGDSYEGKTHLSAIDPSAQRLINTIEIPPSIRIPYRVSNNYWHVPPGTQKPQILHLTDLTGEGVRAQFPLFEYAACGIVQTSAAGYSAKLDRGLIYPIRTRDRESNTASQLFAVKPNRPGHWNFTWGPGHGVIDMMQESVDFDPEHQLFRRAAQLVPPPGLPRNARVIEQEEIQNSKDSRMLVLWMDNPTYFKPPKEAYGASDHLYGGRWVGPAHISVIDPLTNRLINTLDLPKDIPIPEVAHKYGYYPRTKEGEGPVQVLHLQDLTGEGVAGQFYHLEYLNSSTNHTRVYGYSPTRARVVQYPILTQGKQEWSSPGLWHFTYSGDHGDDSIYEEHVTFDRARQLFLRQVKITKQK